MQLSADMALNEAKAILIADCENGGGVMRDDRFNSLKQEFDGARKIPILRCYVLPTW